MPFVSLCTGTNSIRALESDVIIVERSVDMGVGIGSYELSDGLREEGEVPLDTWQQLVCEMEMRQNFAIWQWA